MIPAQDPVASLMARTGVTLLSIKQYKYCLSQRSLVNQVVPGALVLVYPHQEVGI